MSKHMENNDRKLKLGTWISIGSPVVTEVISEMSFDWMLFDLEHGFMQIQDILPNLMAIKSRGIKVIVRISEFSSGDIARLLDWGVAGIMLPHVSDAKEAERVVEAMRYPPMGKRGFSSSSRSFNYGFSCPANKADIESPLFIAQIENFEGVQNAASIAAVEGVDILFIGPRDLSLDLSTRKNHAERILFEDALTKTISAANNSGKKAGILVQSEEKVAEFSDLGFSTFAIGSDLSMLISGCKKIRNI